MRDSSTFLSLAGEIIESENSSFATLIDIDTFNRDLMNSCGSNIHARKSNDFSEVER